MIPNAIPAWQALLLRRRPLTLAALLLFCSCGIMQGQQKQPAWAGTLVAKDGALLPGATLTLTATSGVAIAGVSDANGSFQIEAIAPGTYSLQVTMRDGRHSASVPVTIAADSGRVQVVAADAGALSVLPAANQTHLGGEQLTSSAVSEIPLNKRDFSALLLLAAGTSTDANGATNFTQQFAINGQRGVEATFAMDGADTSDPELGGATFSNFNVDAIEGIESSSGWMPAEIGRGASGLTNISTRAGTRSFHGSFFEFLRNSALDARNYFDHPSVESPGRIPPFRRNEFGLTNGGPIYIPHGRPQDGTYYFVELQGFRQVLGTTQVFPVPSAAERSGMDATAFPGDTLILPVAAPIARLLQRYPLPNYPAGPYGIHTYATSSKVATHADQLSVRFDHDAGTRNHFFVRASFDNLLGPTTNPDQTVLDPSFGVEYLDHQRNLAVSYSRTPSSTVSLQTEFSIIRTTPTFHTSNTTDPAAKFNDGLYESFNTAGGSVSAAFSNLFSVRQGFTYTTPHHAWKAGGELRLNRDTTYFGQSPNGEYDFGGGTAYSPVELRSTSGAHTIHAGDALPDTLSSFLLGSPFVYTAAIAPPYISGGAHIGPAAISRNAGDVYAQDTWKLSPRFVLEYGLRYEHYSPIEERAHRTSGLLAASNPVGQVFVVNPQPPYRSIRFEWGPRVQLDARVTTTLRLHAGAGLTTIPPNIWQDNFLTGGTPFVIYPRLTSSSAASIPFGYQITSSQLPRAYTPSGVDIFPGNRTSQVKGNTVLDIDRYTRELAALSPGGQVTPLNVSSVDRSFSNAYLSTLTLGVERTFAGLTADAAYITTSASHLPRIAFPNGYPGADPAFAPHTEFDTHGRVVGGFGNEQVISAVSHSTYHALQTSLQGTVAHGGPGLQASYTWSKSLDDTSSVVGASGTTGAVGSAFPQNPFNTRQEKGLSTFDTAHVFTLSLAQDLRLGQLSVLHLVSRRLTNGWELLSISTITSGSPFSIYSGVQQTGVGSMSVDRPDQVARPHLSTARHRREDYFGLGDANPSYFFIPIHIPGGTGPNAGRFGALGRDTFRGPAFYDYDFSLIKDTPLGHKHTGTELADLQFRAEFFNLFNIVNMGLPANTLTGSGFGEISRTAGTSRQVQFSLKVLY